MSNVFLMNHWSRSSIRGSRSEHGGLPRRDDDEFALAAERIGGRGLGYAPDDVPPATDPRRKEPEAVDLSEGSEAPNRRLSPSTQLRRSAMRSAIFANAERTIDLHYQI